MSRKTVTFLTTLALSAGLACAQTEKPKVTPAPSATKPAAATPGQPTEEQMKMMQACVEAGTPGKEHAHLAKSVGTWDGVVKHWMSPEMTPMESKCVTTMTSIMDGRFVRCETEGDMPGMGTFKGAGVYGFDNVSKQFQSTWIDNFGTGIMFGTGELSSDGKTMTWTMTYNCPMTKQAKTMREVDRTIDDNHSVLEMYGPDMTTGKEFKMMEITYTRKGAAPAATPAAKPATTPRPAPTK